MPDSLEAEFEKQRRASIGGGTGSVPIKRQASRRFTPETVVPLNAFDRPLFAALASKNEGNLCLKYLLELNDGGDLVDLPPGLFNRLMNCCRSGLENPDSSIGCYAMEPSDYDELGIFFDKVSYGV